MLKRVHIFLNWKSSTAFGGPSNSGARGQCLECPVVYQALIVVFFCYITHLAVILILAIAPKFKNNNYQQNSYNIICLSLVAKRKYNFQHIMLLVIFTPNYMHLWQNNRHIKRWRHCKICNEMILKELRNFINILYFYKTEKNNT